MKKPLFEGPATALVTPFRKNDKIDFKAWQRLIDYQIDNGIETMVAMGTTGENPTLETDEEQSLIKSALEVTALRAKLIVGTGSINPKHAVEASERAMKAGADAVLAVTPYYNKPTQTELIDYYTEIAKVAPTILYNVPDRTGVNITPRTAVELADNPNIVGLKDAYDCQIIEMAHVLDGVLPLYCGHDASNFAAYVMGAAGAISVSSNVIPAKQRKLYEFVKAGLLDEARALHNEIFDFNAALFAESNPIPVKYALSKIGICNNYLRAPLTKANPETERKIYETMQQLFDLKFGGCKHL